MSSRNEDTNLKSEFVSDNAIFVSQLSLMKKIIVPGMSVDDTLPRGTAIYEHFKHWRNYVLRPRKKCYYAFLPNFAKYWLISKIILLADLAVKALK